MSTSRIIILIFLGICEFSQAQIDSKRNGYDISLINLDRIMKNNSNIVENPSQHLINWGEIPNNLKGIRKIVQYKGDYCLPDSTSISEKVIIDGVVKNINLDTSSLYIKDYYEQNDSTIVESYCVFLNEEEEEEEEELFFTIRDQYIYVKDTLKQSIRSTGRDSPPKWTYNYYSSGNLKEIKIDTFFRLSSEILGDTIIYHSHYDYYIFKKIMSDKGDHPSAMIKMFKTNYDSCYCYKSHVTWLPSVSLNTPNKEIIQCKNGRIINEIRWDKKDQYSTIAKNDSFNYGDANLISKTSKIENKNSFHQITYTHNKNGQLVEMKDSSKGRKYRYDSKGNIVKIIEYWLDNKEVSDITIRRIEYTN